MIWKETEWETIGAYRCGAVELSSRSACICSVHGLRDTEPCDLLPVEATEPQVPDPYIDAAELVLDHPLPSRSNTEIERTPAATGQEGERHDRVRLVATHAHHACRMR